MKLVERERVEGTIVTIGRRVFERNGTCKVSSKYVAKYRNASGKEVCESLRVTNRALARRRALEIQQRLERGEAPPVKDTLTMDELIERYTEYVRLRQAAPKTIAKYSADLDKLKTFSAEQKIERAGTFGEEELLRFRAWLQERKYADKTIFGALNLTKQVLKWAWRKRLLANYTLADVSLPKAKARPQPCFTQEQVDRIIAAAASEPNALEEPLALALMGYAGLRIGEVEQLRWEDIVLDKDGQPSVLHIRRGGSTGTTKDKDERFVPVHPKIGTRLAPVIKDRADRKAAAATEDRVFPTITERKLLGRLKALCKQLEFRKPYQWKLHTFRHFFASLCANHGVAHRKALAWLGHSSSDMLELYYHLHDDDSRQAMAALANGATPANGAAATPAPAISNGQIADTLRTVGQSKIEKLSQVPEFVTLHRSARFSEIVAT